MRLLLTSDLHQWIPKWAALVSACATERPDFVVLAGDLLPKGDHADQRRFFGPMRRHLEEIRISAGSRILLYLGNDDRHLLEPLLDELAHDDLCVNLNRRIHRERGLVFWGLNVVRDYPFGYKHYCVRDDDWERCPIQFMGEGVTLSEDGRYIQLKSLKDYLRNKPSFREELQSAVGKIDADENARSVWIIHQPPSSLGMDICAHGERVGSPVLLEFIEAHQPLLGCSGHIHESPYQPDGRWAARIGRTWWIQPGQLGEELHYVIAEVDETPAVLALHHSVFSSR
jgi:Icc-related predicted phosphoesterase